MSHRLLLVEDEAALASLLERMLVRHGYSVDVCSLGADAVARLGAAEYAAAVVDLTLPDMRGEDVIAAARCPVIVTSGLAISARAFPHAAAILQKPFPAQALIEAVARLVG